MMQRNDQFQAQLKDACRLTRARWVVWVRHAQNTWNFGLRYALSKRRESFLLEYIKQEKIASWFAGSLGSGRARSKDAGSHAAQLGCQRLYIYPNPETHCLLLVAADMLTNESESLWRLLALTPTPDHETIIQGVEEYSLDSMIPLDVERETSYDPQGTLERIIEYLVKTSHCEAGYLAIRSGDVFRLEALWHCPSELLGADISLQENDTLAYMVASQQGMVYNDLRREPFLNLHNLDEIPVRSWMGVPVIVGQRVIGFSAFISRQPGFFVPPALTRMTVHTTRFAYRIENAIVFAELARYLQQLALLNELASTASMGLDIDEVSRRVMQRLRRFFEADWAAVFLLSPDKKMLKEYGGAPQKTAFSIPVESSLEGYAIASGLPFRVGDNSESPRPFQILPDVRSELAVPLKYRGKVIGLIVLLSKETNAFSLQDEQLLAVIASHLAGLFENMRLNEETRERAQKLQDTVRQLQAVRETALDIAGDLDLNTLLQRVVHRAKELAQARGAELGFVNEEDQTVLIAVSETPWRTTQGHKLPWMAGIAGRLAAFGEPIVIADYNSWPGRLHPEKKAPFSTAAGVPMRFKGQVIGTLTVMDDRKDKKFEQEDIQLLELLAPQAAISIRNARLYLELEERIRAQRLAESHLIRSARLAAVGEMAAGVAHELNNPLTTVTGFVELALDDLPPDSPQRADLELVLQESLRARGVVRRLLDFSRPAEDQRLLTDINEVVNQVSTLVNHLARTSGVIIKIELQDILPWSWTDPNQIKQVLLNLMHNALQAMPSGGELVIKTGFEQRDDQSWVTIAVRDTGVGISRENMERIFEPFFTTRPASKGTGLGLSVSYGIISSHGGTIEVESQLGKGSTFMVYLPTEKPKEGDDHHA